MISTDTFELHGDIEASLNNDGHNVWSHPWFRLALRDWFVNNTYLSFNEYFQLSQRVVTLDYSCSSRITLLAINSHKQHNERDGWNLVSISHGDRNGRSNLKLLYLQINSLRKTLQSFSIQDILDNL